MESSPHDGFEVESQLGSAESDDAKTYWASIGVRPFYAGEKHWSALMADRVLASRPQRVLEFGCNVGRNLKAIHDRAPHVELVGVDINRDAVAYGRDKWDLDLRVADEEWLQDLERDAFDVLFTVSVFDHLPDPEPVLRSASRVAPRLILLEPWVGAEGRVVRNPGRQGGIVETTPYSYSWDYERLLRDCGMKVGVEPYPLSETNLGPSYQIYTARRRRWRWPGRSRR